MYCTHCGKPIDNEDKFCKNCGHPVSIETKDAANSQKRQEQDDSDSFYDHLNKEANKSISEDEKKYTSVSTHTQEENFCHTVTAPPKNLNSYNKILHPYDHAARILSIIALCMACCKGIWMIATNYTVSSFLMWPDVSLTILAIALITLSIISFVITNNFKPDDQNRKSMSEWNLCISVVTFFLGSYISGIIRIIAAILYMSNGKTNATESI